jgi:hypothetical protein
MRAHNENAVVAGLLKLARTWNTPSRCTSSFTFAITRHMTLRMPPALKTHVTDHVWTFEELADLIDRAE